jgi:hypothetical protein
MTTWMVSTMSPMTSSKENGPPGGAPRGILRSVATESNDALGNSMSAAEGSEIAIGGRYSIVVLPFLKKNAT